MIENKTIIYEAILTVVTNVLKCLELSACSCLTSISSSCVAFSLITSSLTPVSSVLLVEASTSIPSSIAVKTGQSIHTVTPA